jgi:hypothetical protein
MRSRHVASLRTSLKPRATSQYSAEKVIRCISMFGIGLVMASWSFLGAAMVIFVAAVVRISHSFEPISRACNRHCGYAATELRNHSTGWISNDALNLGHELGS